MIRAFDIIQHSLLTVANQAAGLHSELVDYLGRFYQNRFTLMQTLCQNCGANFSNWIICAMSFVDDLVLPADSTVRLQHLMDCTKAFF